MNETGLADAILFLSLPDKKGAPVDDGMTVPGIKMQPDLKGKVIDHSMNTNRHEDGVGGGSSGRSDPLRRLSITSSDATASSSSFAAGAASPFTILSANSARTAAASHAASTESVHLLLQTQVCTLLQFERQGLSRILLLLRVLQKAKVVPAKFPGGSDEG
jgi:hypothetical protein